MAAKIEIPQKIKADLDLLANRAGVPIGQFTRELLASHFLGHTVWTERMVAWAQDEENIATDWENGITEGVTVYLDDWKRKKESEQPAFSKIETMG
jgi:hypothetical protein